MTKRDKPDDEKSSDKDKNDTLNELEAINKDLRGMTVESEEAAHKARLRRQEIERALRNRRFWVPDR